MDKLFKDIENQLNIESRKYKKLKFANMSFEISKVVILSISNWTFIFKYFLLFYQ